ncbi:hypothetical protein NA56DRAFT_698477 [Hyaloscypha hepaticicola]|uniref:Uncharacterized protein n=1 Tax=Hyaloscypha hepaticicola TaxID=2082293 RepID=A0A2J6QJ68_9HELO|nr:hypothetical protein NA56DRAFT_698477 [Hyaloscypha hepaticicola]
MVSSSSNCATYGSIASQSHNASTSAAVFSNSVPNSSTKRSHSEQRELTASRLAEYLEDPTASHVQPQHISTQKSLHILSEKKSNIKSLDTILSEK